MTRAFRIIVAITALAALMVPAARAQDSGAGCGRGQGTADWQGSYTCHFQFRGFPLTVRGDAIANNTADVHVWITATEDDPIPLLECSASGPGYATCDAGLPDQSTVIDLRAWWATLYCHVEGKAHGDFWCQSSLGF